jgi:hypothetical protein
MSANSVHIKLKINFPVILIIVCILHIFFLISKGVPKLDLAFFRKEEPTILKIRQVKTPKIELPNLRPVNSVLNPSHSAQSKNKTITSLKDLAPKAEFTKIPRPGTRPEVFQNKKAINSISLKGSEFKKSYPSGGFAISGLDSGAHKVNDAVVSIEVPDGIEPDELNEYELMFYSFQKRTAINYANSILSHLDKFNKKYPNYKLTESSRIIMTARMTYDEKGNVKQIKMIRWTHVNEIQNFFEEVMKGIDQLHNPPKALWEKQGEFSMFFTLEILTG